MSWLPCALIFAIFGFVVAAGFVLSAVVIAGLWLLRGVRWAVDAVWAWWYGFRLPASPSHRPWIPAAPAPCKPQPHRLTEEHIRAEAQRIETELLAEFGDDFARILGLFADDPHTSDR